MIPGPDQRRSDRRPIETPVDLRVLSTTLRGLSDNLSGVGLLLTSEESLVVEVELDVDGERIKKSGRLIRLARIDEGTSGLAIEFDD